VRECLSRSQGHNRQPTYHVSTGRRAPPVTIPIGLEGNYQRDFGTGKSGTTTSVFHQLSSVGLINKVPIGGEDSVGVAHCRPTIVTIFSKPPSNGPHRSSYHQNP